MKRAATPPPASPQRTIGEILLEHGYVTQEDLAAAVQRQEETGFPLGQILVEAGAITRLELASALAVQWADVAPARGPLEEQTGRARAAREDEEEDENEAPLFSYAAPPTDDAWRDEIRTAARAFAQRLDTVEHSLDELRGDTAAGEPDFDVEARFSDLLGPLARHVDETAHRVQAVEAALESVGTQSRAVGEAAESIREELARRATAATAAIDELAARLDEARLPERSESAEPAEVAALRTEVAHLRAEVTAFAATQHADPTARDQLTTLAARVDALADPTALQDLRRALDSLAERPTSDPVLAGRVQELAARLDELAETPPSADAELTGRVDELSAILASLTATVEEVRARPGGDAGLEERVDELGRRVHVVAEAGEAVAALEVKLGVLTSELNDVVDRVSRIHHEPADSGLAELAARLEALEVAPAPSGGTPTFEGPDAEGMEQLTAQIAEATAAWERDRAALEARVTELAQRVARAPAAAATADESTDAAPNEHDLNRLWFAVERLSLQLTEHHRTLGMLMGGASGEGQLEALAARVDILERLGGGAPRAADGSAPAAGDGASYGGDMAALARRVEEVALASDAGREKLLTQLEQMMSSLDWRFQRLEGGGKAA